MHEKYKSAIINTRFEKRSRDDPLFDVILDLLVLSNQVEFHLPGNQCNNGELNKIINGFDEFGLREIVTDYEVGSGVTRIFLKWDDNIIYEG